MCSTTSRRRSISVGTARSSWTSARRPRRLGNVRRRTTATCRSGRAREAGVCYAVSTDGIERNKPELGLVEFEGSAANNIAMRGEDMRGRFYGPHGAGVIKDMRDPHSERRYEMFFRAQEMAVAFSADGVRWSPPSLTPEIEAPGDTHNNAFWVPA